MSVSILSLLIFGNIALVHFLGLEINQEEYRWLNLLLISPSIGIGFFLVGIVNWQITLLNAGFQVRFGENSISFSNLDDYDVRFSSSANMQAKPVDCEFLHGRLSRRFWLFDRFALIASNRNLRVYHPLISYSRWAMWFFYPVDMKLVAKQFNTYIRTRYARSKNQIEALTVT